MKRWSSRSLVMQLCLFSVGILFSLMAAFAVTNIYVRNNEKQNMLYMNEKILFQIQGKLEDYYNKINHEAVTLSYSPTTKRYFRQTELDRVISAKDLETVFANIMLLDEDIAGISLYDNSFICIASVGKEPNRNTAAGESSDRIEFGNSFIDGQSGRHFFTVSYPVYDLEDWQYGSQIGTVVLVMKTDSLKNFLLDSGVTRNTELYLLDDTGEIVESSQEDDKTISAERLQDDTGYQVRILETAINGWRLVSRIPKKELYRGTGGSMGLVIIAYGIACAMIGIMIWFFYKNFIRRIYRMDQFIREAAHESGKRMEEQWEDEIGRLVCSLNQMLDDRERMDREIQDSQKKMYEVELAEKQLQILAYRNQINPHFLYNTFDCIRGMALYYDMDDIAEITMALSKVFRYAVKEENIVTVRDELDYIREYATIIEYRFMDKIEVEIDAEEEILQNRVIRLMLQPIVENAVFHGLEQKLDDGCVTVTVRRKLDRFLMFLIEDNGCGMEEEKLRQLIGSLEDGMDRKGIGLANIYQRLRLFYGKDVVFEIKSEPGKGTRVMIVVPDNVESG